MNNRTPLTLLALTSYVIGAVIGLFLVFIATWANMESNFYGFPRLADAGLGGFNCPVLMTRNDTGTISLTVKNTTDNKLSPSIKTMISTPALPEEHLENLELAPGESRKLEWSVGHGNIDLGEFIFAKVLMYSAYPLPSKENTCGIFILNLPGSGKVILPILVLLSILGMGWGLFEMNKFGVSNERLEWFVRPMVFLAIVIILGFALSFTSRWIPSALVLAV
jgi:hypothetical protein